MDTSWYDDDDGDYDEKSDFGLPRRILRELELQEMNYPIEETELFDDEEEGILRVWKRQHDEDLETASDPPEIRSWPPRGPPLAQAGGLVQTKLDSIHLQIASYLGDNDRGTFERFIARLFEMVYDVRRNLDHDVYATLTYNQATGWPRVEIWTRVPPSPHDANNLLEHTKHLIRNMAETDAAELPQILRVSWKLCGGGGGSGQTTQDVVRNWGDRSCHFGKLDLARCLGQFPRCTLNLGWFRRPGQEKEPLDEDLIRCYMRPRPRASPHVFGGCPSGPGGHGGSSLELESAARGRGWMAQVYRGLKSQLGSSYRPRIRATLRRTGPAIAT
ncbi:hypothetical protein SAMD00023353_0104630 [Rosellinia necatrix]|uniref:Uncharacterized protein n=1 Tax=Rosellinia necatrix TaxID=77044 RepID=A0A1S7UIA8_ROSNE|nr:hypothetical protein SAMD00023353_0104630 [Rosellinia necatrix]